MAAAGYLNTTVGEISVSITEVHGEPADAVLVVEPAEHEGIVAGDIAMPETIAVEKIELMKTLGARVLLCPSVPFTDERHYFHVAAKLGAEPGHFCTSQFENSETSLGSLRRQIAAEVLSYHAQANGLERPKADRAAEERERVKQAVLLLSG